MKPIQLQTTQLEQLPTVDNSVGVKKEESSLNSILMLSECVVERLTIEVALRYGSCKFLQSTVVVCSYRKMEV